MRIDIQCATGVMALLTIGMVLVGCTDTVTNPIAPAPVALEEGSVTRPQVGGPPVADVAGPWSFQERIWVLQPSALNAVIGAPVVDTPMTQVVCDAEGTLDLDQQGAGFEGLATQSVICRVGDVQFVPPPFAFNPVFAIRNGRITGRSVSFDTGHVIGDGDEVPTQPSDCPNRGSVTMQGGVVVAMRMIGDCPTPFDPGEHHSTWHIQRQ